jgi:hypothetical protein
MSEAVPQKFRPTGVQRSPFVSLPKALDRAREMYKIAATFEAAVGTVVKAWGYAEKSSGGVQTVAALKTFGLLDDSGSGATRKVKLSETALKIIRDPREISSERDLLIRQAALRPPGHRAVIDQFGGGLPPSDEAFKAYLIMDLQLRDGAVDEFMREFSETMASAKIGATDIISAESKGISGDGSNGGDIPAKMAAKIGDYVQWTSNGVDQFKLPLKVVWVSDDGSHLRVFGGSMTGIPMAEVSVVDAPKVPPTGVVAGTGIAAGKSTARAYADVVDGELNVLLRGKRLEITADVDREGLVRLKEILGKYEEILKLIDPPQSS